MLTDIEHVEADEVRLDIEVYETNELISLMVEIEAGHIDIDEVDDGDEGMVVFEMEVEMMMREVDEEVDM